ncbi:hypothetical protein BS47DRAFT_1340198 [Hydnum rufescens UP504]|uniref:Heat shock factor-binding protein 1 n=1 Tax=Hydnum rufescens UP504 TaxID=1448309 RepID=A0A9P6B4P0_9AGAM|nr:hypothetical protein BS47DRAFT_1340198 [Hydnum rufescens UP504]
MSKPLKVGNSFSRRIPKPGSPSPVSNSPIVRSATDTTISETKTNTFARPEEISSPHELTAFVETLLSQLEGRFDDMSNQILDRMNQMSSRVDALESSIHDLINGDIARPATPSTPGNSHPWRRESNDSAS